MTTENCIIVGASHAGVQLALSLRQLGWGGDISLIGEENAAFYQRPPLSKDLLTGAKTAEEIPIRPPAIVDRANLDFQPGVRVEKIDRRNRCVRLDDGRELQYQRLALTTGARPRQLPLTGSDKSGVHYLRSLSDIKEIRAHIRPGKRAVIIGGGYIGLEAAASMRKMGMHVTVLEAMSRVLQRVTAPVVSKFFERIHAEEGVEILTDDYVLSVEGEHAVDHVRCANGTEIDADLVIVAVGIEPNVELAQQCGLDVDDGILVDEFARTSDENIVAAGDCARFFSPLYQRSVRLECIQNATDQAKTAAATLVGDRHEYKALPWFWSDQYDVKLQIAGLSDGYDDCIVRGDSEQGRSFAAFYFKGDRLLAADAINRPAEFMCAKKMILAETIIDKATLADESVAIKSLLG